MPTQDDLIITGPREIESDGQITIPIDETKGKEAQKKLEAFNNFRKSETQQEEEELARKNQSNQLLLQNQHSLEKIDVGQLGQTGSRVVKSRSNTSAIQACTEVVGYLPKRGDFDQEYDMDAELLLADMEFFDEDTTEDENLKHSVIELYNARLDERIRRKKFVIERGLLDLKRTQKFERKRSKEEREIINSMKIFARFNTEEDHQRIVNNLIKERLLREVIEQIKFFRSKGLTSLDQIEKFIESQKKAQSSQFK